MFYGMDTRGRFVQDVAYMDHLSVGIATSKDHENVSIWKLYEQADRQMYIQKQERR